MEEKIMEVGPNPIQVIISVLPLALCLLHYLTFAGVALGFLIPFNFASKFASSLDWLTKLLYLLD